MSIVRLALGLSLLASAVAAQPQLAGRETAVRRLHAWTGLSASAAIAITPEMAVALVGRGAKGEAAGRLDGVELQGEVLDEAFAQERGWRSMRLKVDLTCADGGSTWVRRMTVYAGHNRAGVAREAVTPAGWVRPKPDAYLGQTVSALCGRAAAPVAEAVAAPLALRGTQGLPSSAEVAQPTIPSAGPSVQIAASPVEADARRARGGPASALLAAAPQLNFHVEPALSNGRPVFRALVSGFIDASAARNWCARLRSAGGACFLR